VGQVERGINHACEKLTQEEVENFKIWRTHFLEEGDSFEENGMEWMPSGCAIGRIKRQNVHS